MLKKIFLGIAVVIILIAVAAACYLKFVLPNVGPSPDMKVEITPGRVARGEYLAKHVTICIDCHSKRDWSIFSGPPIEGTFGMGGEIFDRKFGFPGVYYATNITPEEIGNHTDGELFRAITTGVTSHGKAIFPVMPFHYYGMMDEEDIKSIIAYLRTLPPVKNKVPESVSDFPMNFIINTLPHKSNLTKLPLKIKVAAYGKYLVTAAACVDCHSPIKNGRLVAGAEFSGGREFPFPDGSIVRSSNITPDEETGIGALKDEMFIHYFRMHSDSATVHTHLKPGSFNSIMPWTMYGGMTDEDLTAIFTYLKTLRPVKNEVTVFIPAKKR